MAIYQYLHSFKIQCMPKPCRKDIFFVSMYKAIRVRLQLVLMNLLFMDIKCLDIGMDTSHTPRPSDDPTLTNISRFPSRGTLPPRRTCASGQGELLGPRPYISICQVLEVGELLVCLLAFIFNGRSHFLDGKNFSCLHGVN